MRAYKFLAQFCYLSSNTRLASALYRLISFCPLKKLNRYQKLSFVWLLIGLILFAFLVYRTGVSTIVSNIRVFGAYFLLLLLISGMRQVLRTFAWRYSSTASIGR